MRCTCLESERTPKRIGKDMTNGRCGQVTLEICSNCGWALLRYKVEYEAFTASGRWFEGWIPPDRVGSVTPETAVPILESLESYRYGGSYFIGLGGGGTSSGKVPVDLV